MRTFRSCAAFVVLAAALIVSLGSTGCAARVSYYDEDHHDYHRWNGNEVVIYRSYWSERHQPYREFSTLNKDEQRDYWKWRHEHH